MKKTDFDIVRSLLRTEKGTHMEPMRKYLFSVDPAVSKIEIRRAIETLYKVKVESVRTVIMPSKLKRVRLQVGRTPEWKKAIVTLKEGHKIEVT
jgi:large subunit ribosomal protein L23